MEPGRLLLIAGIVLLSSAALLGFVQYRYRAQPEAFLHWRVVHNGGTAGAVQLLALSAIWAPSAGQGAAATTLAVGVVFATWAFFLGPLARALGRPRAGDVINRVGGLVGLPAYLLLPVILMS